MNLAEIGGKKGFHSHIDYRTENLKLRINKQRDKQGTMNFQIVVNLICTVSHVHHMCMNINTFAAPAKLVKHRN